MLCLSAQASAQRKSWKGAGTPGVATRPKVLNRVRKGGWEGGGQWEVSSPPRVKVEETFRWRGAGPEGAEGRTMQKFGGHQCHAGGREREEVSTQVVGGRGEVLTVVMGQVVFFGEEAIGKDQKVTAPLQAEITGEWQRTCLLRNSQEGLDQGWASQTPRPGLASVHPPACLSSSLPFLKEARLSGDDAKRAVTC